MRQFQTKRANIHETRSVAFTPPALKDGEILVIVERFAFTANNITYGVAGDQIGYWQFFPPADGDADYGVLPVWGFGRVSQTLCQGIDKGERFYGYFPPAHAVIMAPGKIKGARFIDMAAHRAALPAPYNMYTRLSHEPGYEPSGDNYRALFFPLFITSFLLGDYLTQKAYFGAEQIVILSASAKTSVGLGYALKDETSAPKVTGLTSARSVNDLAAKAIYDEVLDYAQVKTLPLRPTVIVDMSGDRAVRAALYDHLGDHLKHCVSVGMTHWDEAPEPANKLPSIPKERAEFFFAPGQAQKRISDWGSDVFNSRVTAFCASAAQRCAAWIKIIETQGLEGLAGIYPAIAKGTMPADEAVIVVMETPAETL